MRRMAVLDETSQVINVIACSDDEQDTPTLVAYTDNNPAYIGGDYYEGYFYPEQPYPSWSRSAGEWLPPVPQPQGMGNWFWNEEAQEWQD
jgi:hypothetical protein